MKIVEKWCEEKGLSINPSKTSGISSDSHNEIGFFSETYFGRSKESSMNDSEIENY